jgi:L-amino acid N-acyltransferase YncA
MIRPASQADEDAIWNIFHAVVATGDTYVFDPQIPREQALACWLRPDTILTLRRVRVVVVGTYILKPNQPALGSHVANASFMVSPTARGSGVGRSMGEHCLAEAPARLSRDAV